MRPHLHHVGLDAAHEVGVGLAKGGHERVQGVLELRADGGLLAPSLALEAHAAPYATTARALASVTQSHVLKQVIHKVRPAGRVVGRGGEGWGVVGSSREWWGVVGSTLCCIC